MIKEISTFPSGMRFLALAFTGLIFVSGCERKNADVRNASDPQVADSSAQEASAPNEKAGFVLATMEETVPVGKTILVETTTEVPDGRVLVVFRGTEMEGTSSFSEVQRQRIEALDENKLRYTILEDRKTERMNIMGQDQNPPEEESPLVDHPLIAERPAGEPWTVRLEKGKITEPMTEKLERMSKALNENFDAKIYGTVPRKVGDEWTSEGVNLMGMEGGSGIFVVKFEGIEDYKGQRCARLTGTVDMTGTPDDVPPSGDLSMRVSGNFSALRSLEHRIDLKNRLEGRLTVGGTLEPQPGVKMDMELVGKMIVEANSEMSPSE